MKKIVMTIALGLMLSISVSAAQIYGTLRENQRPVQADIEIEVKCNGHVYAAKTDSYGAYSLNVEKGKCTFTLKEYKGQQPTAVLYSSNSPLRYDFELVPVNGVYQLRRK